MVLTHNSVDTCADSAEYDRMLVSAQVCEGAGKNAGTDVYKACGVTSSLLSHLKLATIT